MIGDSGDPIGALKVCLYMIFLKVKQVEVKMNFMAERNSLNEIFVICSI